MDLIHGNIGAPNTVLPIEFSQTWPAILAYMESGDPRLIPDKMTVFMIAWINPVNEKYLGWGYYMSTSEPAPYPGAVAFVVAETTVPIKSKSEPAMLEASKHAISVLYETVFRDPAAHYQKFRNKLEADNQDAMNSPSLPVDYVSAAEYKAMTAGRKR